MPIVLWILVAVVALAFLGAGGMKLFRDRASLLADPRMGWATDFSATQIKLIGLAEVLGALGVLLPAALGILPILSPIAAVSLAVLMIGAAATHVRRRENPAPPVVLAVLCLVVAGLFQFGS